MSGSRIITPEEAQDVLARHFAGTLFNLDGVGVDLAHTVATEPDRMRAAVVKALRDVAGDSASEVIERADATENGADL